MFTSSWLWSNRAWKVSLGGVPRLRYLRYTIYHTKRFFAPHAKWRNVDRIAGKHGNTPYVPGTCSIQKQKLKPVQRVAKSNTLRAKSPSTKKKWFRALKKWFRARKDCMRKATKKRFRASKDCMRTAPHAEEHPSPTNHGTKIALTRRSACRSSLALAAAWSRTFTASSRRSPVERAAWSLRSAALSAISRLSGAANKWVAITRSVRECNRWQRFILEGRRTKAARRLGFSLHILYTVWYCLRKHGSILKNK